VHTLPFSILNFTLYLKENPLNYLLLQCVFQVICKRLVSKRVMLLHLLYQPHRLGFYLVLQLTSFYTARTKATLLRKYSTIVFINSVMSSRITIAYLLMALKKVTELLLLWSIETTLSVFDYLIQQASSELNALLLAIDVVRRSK